MALYTPQRIIAEYKNRIGYQASILGGICACVSVIILMVNDSTATQIAVEQREDQLEMLDQVLPKNLYNNDLLTDAREVIEMLEISDSSTLYTAKKGDKTVGYAFSLTQEGYSGVINMIMGIDPSGTILGLRVISHTETPGLGDKIEITRDKWILSFNQLSLSSTNRSSWAVKKDGGQFDQFTGATITPRAVVNAAYKALDFHAKHTELFNSPLKDSSTASASTAELTLKDRP